MLPSGWHRGSLHESGTYVALITTLERLAAEQSKLDRCGCMLWEVLRMKLLESGFAQTPTLSDRDCMADAACKWYGVWFPLPRWGFD